MEAVVERCAGIDIGKATVRVQGGARRKTGREVCVNDGRKLTP